MSLAFINVGARSTSASAASLSPALPTSLTNGDILIAHCISFDNSVHSWSGTGWVKIAQQNSGAGFTSSLAMCIVDGNQGTPTCSGIGNVACGAMIAHWTGSDPTNPFSAAHNVNTGSTSTHSCTGVTTTRADSRVIYIDGSATNTNLATPSGWTENWDDRQATGTNDLAGGGKSISPVGTASGDISVVGANAAWVMWQIELRIKLTGSTARLLNRRQRHVRKMRLRGSMAVR